MAVRLCLFGRPAVAHAGATVELPAERRSQLLAVLALRRGWVARTELAALLWPQRPPALALTNVRKALHAARAWPWTADLETQGSAVRFEVDTDVAAFERAWHEGRADEAVALRGGELLDGFDDAGNPAWSEWLDGLRAEHARRWHAAARAHLAGLAAAPADAARFARTLLAHDPFDEDAVVALLAAQHAAGDGTAMRETYRSYAERLAEELGVEPSLRVRAWLREAVSDHAAAAHDGFVGRMRELQDLAALLARPECRALTVTGPGGAGKSRLVKQALRTLAARFADGALWIALDDLTTLPQVVSRLAGELRLMPGAADDPLALVCDAVQPRTLLLVFDNGEHLPDLARLCQRLLQAAPALKVCVTSRTRLHLGGEWLLPLHGLADDDALQLFTAAARALRPDFDGSAQRGAIGTLTQAVGGLPLALLLAANWARLLPVSEIAADLQRSLALLESDDDGEERPEHRSVRATFEQSWQVLAPRERDALAALALFVGGFSRAAAHDVAGATMPLLAALADKSLLQLDAARWSMHPLLRRFAADKLDDASRAAAAQRHAVWFHRWLEQLAPALEDGQRAAQEALDLELQNCRAAWQWALAHDALALLGASSAALRRYYELRGRAAEGVALFGSALPLCAAADVPAGAAAEVWYALAHAQYCIYRLDDAVASARASLKFARAAHARRTMIRALNVLGLAHWQWGRLGDALRYLEQSLRHARALQHVRAETVALGNLALIEKSLGHYARALERTQQVLARQRQFGDWIGVAMRLNDLATLHQAQHDWAAARRCLDEGLAVCEQQGIAIARQSLLLNLAMVSFFDGQFDDAQRIGTQVLDGARASQNRQVESTVLLLLTRLAVRRGNLHDAQALLDEALDGATAMHNLGLQLDALFCRAEMLAAAGDRATAAGLLRYYVARPELEPGERILAQTSLDALACDAPTADAPLERLLEQARQPLAAAVRAI